MSNLKKHIGHWASFAFLLCLAHIGRAQTNISYAGSDEVISFDPVTKKASKPLPFDKPFVITTDSITNTVRNIYIQDVHYRNGQPEDRNSYDSDYKANFIQQKTKLTIFFPPLKPGRNFGILIQTAPSEKKKQLFFALNKKLKNGNCDTTCLKNAWDEIERAFRTEGISARSSSLTFRSSPNNYEAYVCTYNSLMKTDYDILLDATKYPTSTLLTDTQLHEIITSATDNKLAVQSISNIHESPAQLANIFSGLKKTGISNTDLIDTFDFPARIDALKASISITDSARLLTDKLFLITGNDSFKSYTEKLQKMRNAFDSSLKILKKHYGAINKILEDDNRIIEQVWLAGGTQETNLQTVSGSLLSTDVGIMTLAAKNNAGDMIIIPKLFWGLEIYFRQVNRNIMNKNLPRKKFVQSDLLSHRSIFYNLSLSVGLTIGSMKNPEYDNLYNSMSLTIGPSYRFARVLRFSSGLALLRQNSSNPLKADKVITPAAYASFAIDIDFIQTIKNFYGLLFK